VPDTTPSYVDPRGSRFAAWVTTAVLSAVVLSGSGVLLAVQTAVFVTGAALGIRHAPYGRLFRLVRGLAGIGPATELEAEPPLRFAQAVGAAFGVLGTAGYLAGVPALGAGATALALAAAFLNAAFGICLGCEIYLIVRRALGRAALARFVPARTTLERSSA
jgi:hypothetical protein